MLIVRGADLMDGTPIYDIKPYIPYADCHPDAAAGFTAQTQFHHADHGRATPELWARPCLPTSRPRLQGVLENDPRPSYQHDPERVYGMEFGGLEVHFKVDGEVLTVTGIDPPLTPEVTAMELRNINTFLAYRRAAQLFQRCAGAGLLSVGGIGPDLPAGNRAGYASLRPGGQDRPPHRRRARRSRAMPAPFSSRPSRPRPRCCLPGPVSGTLRVALADSVCSTFLPDLLQQFHALCPQVELVLRTATADEMLRLLSANQIDLAYTLDQPLLLPSLTLAVDVPEPVCFVAPAGHPLADKAEVPLDVLAQAGISSHRAGHELP